MELGEKIKKLRKNKRMSLETLANELMKSINEDEKDINFNKGKLSKWENNKEEPKLSSLKYLADYFEVGIDDLIDNTTLTFKNKNIENANNSSIFESNDNTTTNNYYCENDCNKFDNFSQIMAMLGELTTEQLDDLMSIIKILKKQKD